MAHPTGWKDLFTRPFIGITLFYFTIGFMGSSVLITYILKDVYHISPAMMDVLTMARTVPWTIKPVWGFISDKIPIFGGHHKPYILTGVMAFIICGLFASIAHPDYTHAYSILTVMTVSSLALAIPDTVCDGIIARWKKTETSDQNGVYQSTVWIVRFVACVASGLYAAIALTVMTPRAAFGLSTLLPLACLGTMMWYTEDASADADNDNVVSARVACQLMTRYNVWYPILFIAVLGGVPTYGTAIFYYLTSEFSDATVAQMVTIGAVGPVLGTMIYAKWLRQCSVRLVIAATFSCSIMLSFLVIAIVADLITDKYYRFILSCVIFFGLDMAGSIIMMPLLVYFAGETLDGYESTMYAAAVSIANGSGIISKAISAALMSWLDVRTGNYTNLVLFISICLATDILPIMMIVGLPAHTPKTHSAIAQEDSDSDTEMQPKKTNGATGKEAEMSDTESDMGVGDGDAETPTMPVVPMTPRGHSVGQIMAEKAAKQY